MQLLHVKALVGSKVEKPTLKPINYMIPTSRMVDSSARMSEKYSALLVEVTKFDHYCIEMICHICKPVPIFFGSPQYMSAPTQYYLVVMHCYCGVEQR